NAPACGSVLKKNGEVWRLEHPLIAVCWRCGLLTKLPLRLGFFVSRQLPGISEPSSVVHSFEQFAWACLRIAGEARKLEKIRIVAEYLRGLRGEAVGIAATWFSGRPFPASQNKILHVGWA